MNESDTTSPAEQAEIEQWAREEAENEQKSPAASAYELDSRKRQEIVDQIIQHYTPRGGRTNWKLAFAEHPEWAAAIGADDPVKMNRAYASSRNTRYPKPHTVIEPRCPECNRPFATVQALGRHRRAEHACWAKLRVRRLRACNCGTSTNPNQSKDQDRSQLQSPQRL